MLVHRSGACHTSISVRDPGFSSWGSPQERCSNTCPCPRRISHDCFPRGTPCKDKVEAIAGKHLWSWFCSNYSNAEESQLGWSKLLGWWKEKLVDEPEACWWEVWEHFASSWGVQPCPWHRCLGSQWHRCLGSQLPTLQKPKLRWAGLNQALGGAPRAQPELLKAGWHLQRCRSPFWEHVGWFGIWLLNTASG